MSMGSHSTLKASSQWSKGLRTLSGVRDARSRRDDERIASSEPVNVPTLKLRQP